MAVTTVKKVLWRKLNATDAAVFSGDEAGAGGQRHIAFAQGGKSWPRHEEFTSFFGSAEPWTPSEWEKTVHAVDPSSAKSATLTFSRVGRDTQGERYDWNLTTQFGDGTHPALVPGNQLPAAQPDIPGCFMVLIERAVGPTLLWAGPLGDLAKLSQDLRDAVEKDLARVEATTKGTRWGVIADLSVPVDSAISSGAIEQTTVEEDSGDTDGTATVKVRKEQAKLRAKLIGTKTSENCSLCGREAPSTYLWCAHIKPRKDCSEQERADEANLMLACLFGCDSLFEQRDILVAEDGTIELNPDRAHLPVVTDYFSDNLAGKACLSHSAASAPYFAFRTQTETAGD